MWTTEQLEIRNLARDFARREIRPRAGRWDAEGRLDDRILDELAELGFLGMRIPEEYGGLELDLGTYLLVLEELAWGDASLALVVSVQNGPVATLLRDHATPEQKERLFPRMASGELLTAFALAESGSASDGAGLATRAVADDEGWILSGTKSWVAGGDRAGLVVVFAGTDGGGEGPGTLGAFLVEPEAEGCSRRSVPRTMGLRASGTVELHLDGVRVGDDGVVGSAEEGLTMAREALDVGRAGAAGQAVGTARAAYEHAAAYAAEREQFGRHLAEFGGVQEKVAEMVVRISAARALAHEAARRLDATDDVAREAGPAGPGSPAAVSAMSKLAATEAALWVTDQAVQIYGGYGYMRDYPVERLLRDAVGAGIYEGTSATLRRVVAQDVLGGRD